MSPGVLPSGVRSRGGGAEGGVGGGGVWFSSWYVVYIDTRHITQSPQSRPRWSPAFKMEPVLPVSSFKGREPGFKKVDITGNP